MSAAVTLSDRIEAARAEVVRLERIAATASCREVGHAWVFHGGRHCGCFPDAYCSVPVHICSKCGDCDYGDNDEAREQIAACPDPAEYAALEAEYAARELEGVQP